MKLPFENSYAKLPESFFEKAKPTPVIAPSLIAFNDDLATDLGLDSTFLRSTEGLSILAGNVIPQGAEPIATAYSGHQFGGFSPLLGDGRAILLGEVAGQDLQLKGSGPTPFSRRGDGRSALGPVLREYLVSEAMHALGIPTTRALAAVLSGELVLREQPQKGGIFTRIASSHLRIGTAQYFAAQRDTKGLATLVDYANQRHFPDAENAIDLLRNVIAGKANLVAQWMGVGSIHGVMITDNMSLSGETIDYGPCAFMDHFDPQKKFSSIDQQGRYAYHNQPGIAQWNLTRLAEALLPLFSDNEEESVELAKAELEKFPDLFKAARLTIFSKKIGLPENQDWDLIQDLLDLMASEEEDFTNFFRRLSKNIKELPAPFQEWHQRWLAVGTPDLSIMDSVNPAFIPRNHRVEEVIAAAYNGDFDPFHTLHKVLQTPYSEQPDADVFCRPPAAGEVVKATFCGT